MRVTAVGPSLCLLSVSLGACLSDVSVPEGAQIDCASTEDCPASHVCSAALGRCVLAGADDQPPSLDTATLVVAPELASRGVTVEIRFRASEPLGAPPVITLEWAGAPAKRIEDVSEEEGGVHLARYLVSGEEPEGFAALAIDLVDKDGNRNRSAVPRALELDFTPPAVVQETIGVVLEAPADSPIDDVTAAGRGTLVRVLFAASEALLTPPAVLTAEETPLDFVLTSDIGTFFTFAATVPDSALPQGAHDLVADLVDAAGNAARVSLAELVLDTEAPPAPTVDVEDAVTYVRVPWGSEATAGVAAFTLELAPGAVEADAIVIVRDGEDPALASELGRSSRAGAGPLEVTLARTDREAVWVTAVDAAGNESAPERVRDVRWVASLIGRQARSDLRNPHRVRRSSSSLVARDSPLLSEPSTAEIASLAAIDGQSVVARGERAFKRRTLRMPGSRALGELAFDSRRGLAVLFGGYEGELGLPADTWEWDGSDWQQRSPSVAPSGRVAHTLVYDAHRAEAVLFGGFDLTRHKADTWVYDGADWIDVTPSGDSPPPRTMSAAAYDPVRRRMVLFGGATVGGSEGLACDGGTVMADGSCFYGDTWEWDGDAWHLLTPATSPSPRAMSAMAYDESRGGVVLFGGCINTPALFDCPTRENDTWLFDGTTWVELTDAVGPPPEARVAHRLVTTPDGVLLVAGASVGFNSGFELCDTAGSHVCFTPWRLDATGWTALTAAPPLPLEQFPYVAWDSAREHLVALDRTDDKCDPIDSCNRTRAWTESQSELIVHLADRPLPRALVSLSYDEVRERAVTFGGDPQTGACLYDGPNQSNCGELYEWDGYGWDLRCDGAAPGDADYCPLRPDARFDGALVYDAKNALTVLFGGSSSGLCDTSPDSALCDTTWGWDGSAWTILCSPNAGCTSPGNRKGTTLAYDRAREVVLLFGGAGDPSCEPPELQCGDTWQWDGAAWTLAAPAAAGPGPRSGARLAYDEGREVTVLFGGSRTFGDEAAAIAGCTGTRSGQNCLFGDTWEWDGAAWTLVATTDPEGDGDPPPRHDGAFAYDSARARVVLHGGRPAGSEFSDDAWEYDGISWRSTTPSGVIPGPRRGHAMTFDSAREALVMFGGDGEGEATWEWPSGSLSKSAVLVELSFLASGADADLVEEVALSITGGGRGYTLDSVLDDDGDRVGDPIPGAALAVWNASSGRYQSLGTLEGTPDAPVTRTLTSLDADEARRWLASREQALALRVEPVSGGGNGPAGAEVALDYVEATVRYRLPAE